mgnify:FL=1
MTVRSESQKPWKKNSQAMEIWRRLKRNRIAMVGLIILCFLLIVVIFDDLIAVEGINDQNIQNRLKPPSAEHIFGTDPYGRDIFSRIVLGARYSLSMGVVATAISALIGIHLGAISGFYGGRVDNYIMRALDIFMTMPMILLAITIAASLGSGMFNTMIAVGISGSPGIARVTRSAVLGVRNQEYIEAAYSINASDFRIIFRYVLPNAMAPIIVQVTFMVASSILAASSLSFLGLGLKPPTPEWGAMLSTGREFMRDSWWICAFPGLMIMISVLAINMIGDGLRDALDPKLKN